MAADSLFSLSSFRARPELGEGSIPGSELLEAFFVMI